MDFVFLTVTMLALMGLPMGIAQCYRRKRFTPATIMIISISVTIVGFICQREKESEGTLARERIFDAKKTWEVLAKTPVGDQWAVIVKNDGQILAVLLKEDPPERFTVKRTGWWPRKKTRLIAVQ